MQHAFVSLCVLTAVAQLAGNPALAQWGTIKGQNTVTGTMPKLPPLIAKGMGPTRMARSVPQQRSQMNPWLSTPSPAACAMLWSGSAKSRRPSTPTPFQSQIAKSSSG